MRLLFVHDRLGAFGGAEANILATARELGRRGHDAALLHGGASARGGADWPEAFPRRFAVGSADAAGVLQAALAQFQPDVVYVHQLPEPALLPAILGCGRPSVRMIHDHSMYCMRGYKYNPLTRRICRRAASAYCVFPCGASVARGGGAFPLSWVGFRAKRREIGLNRSFGRLVVATRYMKEELLRNGFADERVEIHPPVPAPAQDGGTPSFSARNLIVYAGQLVRGKGVDVLLESLARVSAPFECAVLGDGPHRTACERLSARLGLAAHVHFAGFVPQAQVAVHYRDASLAVMSSLWPEPFGATGLEAMRCGLPVVAFDAGGISEWLLDGVNGFLVPWMDRAAFAAGVDRLLADKALARRLGEAGRRSAADRFGFAAYIDGLEGLFARAASRLPVVEKRVQAVAS
jgi:glycosyltransferase involved in cell wall biosynthesis